MKKFLSIICCLVVIAASSCTKQYVAPAVSTNKSYNSNTIAPSDWALTNDKTAYAVNVTGLDGLTSDFTSYGGVIVSITFDNGGTYEQLPEVYNGVSYSYTYTAGTVTLYSQSASGTTAVVPTSSMIARVILVDAN